MYSMLIWLLLDGVCYRGMILQALYFGFSPVSETGLPEYSDAHTNFVAYGARMPSSLLYRRPMVRA